jgi:hypothetical protein
MRVLDSIIIVRLVDNPSEDPIEVWTYEPGPLDIPQEDTFAELHRVATLNDTLEYPISNVISIKESSTNWGASGTFGEYVISVASGLTGGLGVVALVAATKSVFERVRNRAGSPPEQWELNVEQAEHILKEHIERSYGISRDNLTPIESAVSPNSGQYEFTFSAPDGMGYGGVVSPVGGMPGCTKVWRKHPQ